MAGDYRALRSYVDSREDWAEYDDAAKVVALNTYKGKIPQPIYESDLIAVLSTESIGQVLNWSNYGLVKADIDRQNQVGLKLWAMVLVPMGKINAEEAAAITALCNREIDGGPTVAQSIAGWDQSVTIDDLRSDAYSMAGG